MSDPVFVYDFCQAHLFKTGGDEELFSEKELRTLGWLVSMDGEFKDQPFGILRPIKTAHASSAQTREFVQ